MLPLTLIPRLLSWDREGSPPLLYGLLNVRQVLAQALCRGSKGEVLLAQPVACRQAVLAACCPSQHPKDAISSSPYTVHSNAKKVLMREEAQVSSMGKWSICKCLYAKILLAWSETWKGQALHTHLCNTTRSKLQILKSLCNHLGSWRT